MFRSLLPRHDHRPLAFPSWMPVSVPGSRSKYYLRMRHLLNAKPLPSATHSSDLEGSNQCIEARRCRYFDSWNFWALKSSGFKRYRPVRSREKLILMLRFCSHRRYSPHRRSGPMSNFNPLLWRKPPVSWSYGIAVLAVTAALIVFQVAAAPSGSCSVHCFFAPSFSVRGSVKFGPGLLAAVLSSLAFYY